MYLSDWLFAISILCSAVIGTRAGLLLAGTCFDLMLKNVKQQNG